MAVVEKEWEARREAGRRSRRGRKRKRAKGAGRPFALPFCARFSVCLAHLRLGMPRACLALLMGVSRQTADNAVNEILPILAEMGIEPVPGVRLKTLDDVFAYASKVGVDLAADGTDIQVRRPKAGHPRRHT